MSQITTTPKLFEELDYRESDDLEVWLLWNRTSNEAVVLVVDEKTSETFEVATHGRKPLDVFRHPYAYRGCESSAEAASGDTRPAQATA
jgi:hypothetical protein